VVESANVELADVPDDVARHPDASLSADIDAVVSPPRGEVAFESRVVVGFAVHDELEPQPCVNKRFPANENVIILILTDRSARISNEFCLSDN